MQVVLRASAPGVRPSDAVAWWWDFQDGKTDHAFLWIRTRRRVLARAPDRVEAEERAPLFRERWRAWLGADEVRLEGRNGFSEFEGRYRFEPSADGTLVTLEARIRLRGVWRAGAWLAPPVVRAILRADLRGHVRDMARDAARAAPG